MELHNTQECFVQLWLRLERTRRLLGGQSKRFCIRRVLKTWFGLEATNDFIWEVCFRCDQSGWDELPLPSLYPLKHRELYRQDDPLRPELYRADTLFAIAMCASPLGWMELSNLERVSVEQMKPLVARWKTERERIHGGVTYPVGAQPDGRSWTGFATVAPDGGGYLLLFRELSKQATWSFDAREIVPGASRLEVIGGRGAAELRADGFADVTVPEPLDFVWAKVDIPARSGK